MFDDKEIDIDDDGNQHKFNKNPYTQYADKSWLFIITHKYKNRV